MGAPEQAEGLVFDQALEGVDIIVTPFDRSARSGPGV
jgi:hypothetical protein